MSLSVISSDNRVLSILNLANNNIGQLVLPEGWSEDKDRWGHTKGYTHADGREQKGHPGKPEGAIALANAIKDMGAIFTVIVNTFALPIQDIKFKAELDFSGKGLKVEDAIVIAALIPSNVSTQLFPRPCYR
jgi:hypothetical protein